MSSSETIAIIDYGSGNLRSAAKAFERAIRESGSDQRVVVTSDPDQVRRAGRIVLPGVGAFGDCLAGLAAIDGIIETLREAVLDHGKPFLGICVGMQLLASTAHEYGDHTGLDWIAGHVEKLKPEDASLKIPHMGWNTLHIVNPHPIFHGLDNGAHVYFVHSNHLKTKNPDDRIAIANYGGVITAMVGLDNIIGTQFHPEKSQAAGIRLLQNFLTWKP
jgi:glutamine amidotransferase